MDLHLKRGEFELSISVTADEEEVARGLIFDLSQTGVLTVPSRPVLSVRPETSQTVPTIGQASVRVRPEMSQTVPALPPASEASRPRPSWSVPPSVQSVLPVPDADYQAPEVLPRTAAPRWGWIAVLLGVSIGLLVLTVRFRYQQKSFVAAPVVSPSPLTTVPMRKP